MGPAEHAQLIEAEAGRQGHKLGWSLYYCPMAWARSARLATIGLNPGGGRDDGTDWARRTQLEDHVGNSYLCQSWGTNGGKTVLQTQIARLLAVAGVEQEDVVSLNVVPFRSPSWAELANKKAAVDFGLNLVSEALRSPRLRLIVGFGLSAIESRLVDRLGFVQQDRLPTGWGTIQAGRFVRKEQTLLLLPHLSRFGVLGREQGAGLESAIRKAMG
ncbi:MAG: hypothetical protein ABIT10_05485 [Alteraurantiacibacter sp.]